MWVSSMQRCWARTLEQGAYDEFVDRKTFAERVTKDLKSLHEDRHLSLKDITTHQKTNGRAKVQHRCREDADDASTSMPPDAENMTEFSDLGTDSNNSHYGFKTVKMDSGECCLYRVEPIPGISPGGESCA